VSQLTIGTHVLTARVVDGTGLVATASVTLTIASAPEVAIVAPAAGTSVAGWTPVILVAAAVDALEGDLGAGIRWTSDRDGSLGISAVTDDGSLVLALDTTSSDGVLYASREGASGQPQRLRTVADPPGATSTPPPGAP